MLSHLTAWLETRWVTPAYSGWVLLGITLFFLGAATNTMAGWLYVISGATIALMSIASMLPQRVLRHLTVRRLSPRPVAAGEPLVMTLQVHNAASQPQTLLQLEDAIPPALGQRPQGAVAAIAAQSYYTWQYSLPTQQRGIYVWNHIRLRTAAPLGLFWCSRLSSAKAKAVVYPAILPLERCPLMDAAGDTIGSPTVAATATSAIGNDGLTRALRPYRWGDPTRLIHWRTSARYGELRVRELETATSRRSLIVGLDLASDWHLECFEQAVTAAASLYCYGERRGLDVQFWSAATGLLQSRLSILTALAGIQPDASARRPLPQQSLLWLTARPDSPLSGQSLALVFQPEVSEFQAGQKTIGLTGDLQRQLES